MKADFTSVPARTTRMWAFLVIPAVVIAYPVARIVAPVIVHAVVPDVVRTVLNLI